MIRLTVLSSVFSESMGGKDWYKAVCGLVVLAFLEHADMPRIIFGVRGLNLWNLLLLSIILGWMAQQCSERLMLRVTASGPVLVRFRVVRAVHSVREPKTDPADIRV